MKFEVQVGVFRDAVAKARSTTDTTIPDFQGLFISASAEDGGKLEIYSMKDGAKSLFPIAAKVTTAGSLVVRGQQMLAGLKGLPLSEAVVFHFAPEVNRLVGQCGESMFRLEILDGRTTLENNRRQMRLFELPEPVAETENTVVLQSTDGSSATVFDAALLRKVVRRAAWCAHALGEDPKDSTKVLNSMEFTATSTGYKVIATDGYVAARVNVKTEIPVTSMVVLRDSLETVAGFLAPIPGDKVSVIQQATKDANEVQFRATGFVYDGGQGPTSFPKTEAIFSRPEFAPTLEVLVKRSVLARRLARVAGFTEKRDPVVILRIRGTILTLATSSDRGDCLESMTVSYTEGSPSGKDVSEVHVAVANDYLSNALSALDSEYVVLGVRNTHAPLVVSDESDAEITTRYYLMSIKTDMQVWDGPAAPAEVTPIGPASSAVPVAASQAA